MVSSGEDYRVVKCGRCRLLFTLPYVSADNVSGYYPGKYYGGIRRKAPVEKASGFEARFSDRYSRILWKVLEGKGKGFLSHICYLFVELLTLPLFRYKNRCLPYRERPGSLLDIGCGSGKLLREEKRLGWDVHGVELDPRSSSHARDVEGFDVVTGNFMDAGYERGCFDVIVMNHVLEHFLNPLTELGKVRDILRPDGIVAIRLPDQSRIEKALFGRRWHAYELPRHRFHFDRKSIRRLLLKGGFEPLSIVRLLNVNNMILSIRYLFEDMGAPERVTRFCNIDNRLLRGMLLPAGFVLKVLGQSSEMLVYAKKGK